MLFLKKKTAPARNAPVVVRARSSENRRMFLQNIEETPRSTLWKQILMKWVYHKGKTENRFYHENFDPTCKYHCKFIFYKKPWNEYSSVRSFCTGRFDPNMKEESGFRQKTCQSQMLTFWESQWFPGFGWKLGPIPKMKWWIMMPDIKSIHWNVPNSLSHWLDAVRGPTNGSGRGTRSNGPRISLQPLGYPSRCKQPS